MTSDGRCDGHGGAEWSSGVALRSRVGSVSTSSVVQAPMPRASVVDCIAPCYRRLILRPVELPLPCAVGSLRPAAASPGKRSGRCSHTLCRCVLHRSAKVQPAEMRTVRRRAAASCSALLCCDMLARRYNAMSLVAVLVYRLDDWRGQHVVSSEPPDEHESGLWRNARVAPIGPSRLQRSTHSLATAASQASTSALHLSAALESYNYSTNQN